MGSLVVQLCSGLRQTNRAVVSFERVNANQAPVCGPPTPAIHANRHASRSPVAAALDGRLATVDR